MKVQGSKVFGLYTVGVIKNYFSATFWIIPAKMMTKEIRTPIIKPLTWSFQFPPLKALILRLARIQTKFSVANFPRWQTVE